MKTVMTIAGSDSGAGAGIQADLKTFAAHGVYGTSAITAVTAQNTVGIASVFLLPADIVIAQMEAIAGDFAVHAAKTGLLGSAAVVEAVAATIETLELPHVVVDPVIVATSGERLMDADAVAALKSELLRRAHVVTPNAAEAAMLSGIPVATLADAREAARRILALGPAAVLVTGGHLETEDATDVLYDGHDFREFRARRLDARHTHGSGCSFAAAVAANLALGYPLGEAVQRAKQYVTAAMEHGLELGRGRGPVDHFWSGAPKTPPAIL